ncbi:SMC family ATPase [Candidatus Bathyarchaeota archaeon]|nr:SMC family ATPase [Candidatus Bathyarchaeota archaeon]
MKIEIVQLENIRSHVKSTVPFARGFNCLVGGVGCGKSSILYAIDFALFGDPVGRSFEYLLREDVDSGKVTVQFVQNGKNYTITRGLKRRGKGIGQDFEELKFFEDETLIASLKTDAVDEQFKAITGLDKTLFREIVWVRQEHLKELLDAAPRERQKSLDELFGFSDFEAAWNNIAIYHRDYQRENEFYEKDPDVTGMEKLNNEYNRTVEQFSLIQVEIEDTARKLASAKRTLEDADLKLKKLEELRTKAEELRRKEAQNSANLSNLENASALLEEKIKTKRTMIGNLEQSLTTANKQLDSSKSELRQIGILPDQPVETLRQYLTTFDSQITSLKGQQEAASRGMRENQKRSSQLTAESRCPTCLQTLSEEYKNGLTQRILDENSGFQKELSRLQHEIEELQQLRTRASNAFSNMRELTIRLDDLKSRMDDESQVLTGLLKELDEKRQMRMETQTLLEALRGEICTLDMSELEAARDHREQLLGQYHVLQSDLRTRTNRKDDFVKRLDDARERIDLAQQKIERMERIVKIGEIISCIRDAYRNIQPKLRREFVQVLRNFVQQVLDGLVGDEGPMLNVTIDETYAPYVTSEGGVERDVINLSGGERTLLAFAYRLGLGQLIMLSKTGHGLSMLLLDEPTESLGREDGSIDRLAEAISRFKATEQIIAVTHSEAFAEKAEHVIRLEKEAGVSTVSVER